MPGSPFPDRADGGAHVPRAIAQERSAVWNLSFDRVTVPRCRPTDLSSMLWHSSKKEKSHPLRTVAHMYPTVLLTCENHYIRKKL